MDFIDNQAEESDASTDRSDDEEPQSKKLKLSKDKSKKKKKVVASSDEDEDDEDDEEEGRKEMQGFIADEDDEEEDARSEKSDRSRRSEVNDELDDEDLDLIDENLDRQGARKKNRVRLGDSSDEDEPARTANRDDDDLQSERGSDDGDRRHHRGGRGGGGYGSESDRSEDDFIEDDGDAPKRHRKRHRGDEHIPEGAEEDARDVFGVEDFNFDEFYDDDEADDGLEDEEEEIIEDDGEGGEIRIRRKKDTSKKTTLLESIEPSELERGFLSAVDKKIMIEDAPERFQLRRTPVTEADEDELEREAQWIMKFAFEETSVTNQSSFDMNDKLECMMNMDNSNQEERKRAVIDAIKAVLRFIRVRSNSFEVPFIGFYRKESIDNLLTLNNLWTVYDFDEKWCHLSEKKTKLYDLMRRMREYQELSDDLTAKRRPISEMDLIEINFTETLEQLTDIHANFQLLYGALLEDMTKWEKARRTGEEEGHEYRAKFKSSIRNDKYQMCVENGIGELAGRFGLTAKQFAENLDWRKHDIEQDTAFPLDAAEEYICPAFMDRETVLNGAKFMLAKEISRQPLVRNRIRQEFRNNAHFWVKPTKKGRETIDESHPLFDKRYIKNKPIRNLTEEEFLYYHKAKEDGLIDMVFMYESDEDQEANNYLVNKFLSDSIFRKDEYTENVEQWNAVRDECVSMAINEMLVPYMRDEVYNTILEEAKTAVAKKCRKEFASRISRSGFQPENDNHDDDDDDVDDHGARRIMAVCYSTVREEASFGVMVDENGSIVDYLRMVHFTKRTMAQGNTGALKRESMDLFKKFVQRRRPHAIGLNIEDMDCTRLKRDLEEAVQELYSQNMIIRQIPVFLMDNEAAKVYMRSNISVAENPDHPPTLRQAVSLARILLDPIPEYAHLWNSDEDIFCLSLHPLQREIDQEQLALVLNHELVNKVNEEGVDINKCAEFPHYTNMLQFTCGLGPRKATALLKSIKANDNLIESRSKLVVGCKLGPKVFMNCAGFIRIDTHKVSDKTEAYVEVLDGSRVHPETYEWARKMAVDALEVDDSADPTAALQEIMESPDRLRDLDLDAFADELNRQGFGEKKSTLYDISSELSARYKDLREPFLEPRGEDLYNLLARCGKEIKEGSKVLGTVQSVQYRKVDQEAIGSMIPESIDDRFKCPCCKTFIADSPAGIQEHLVNGAHNGGCPGTAVGIRVRFDNGMTGFCPNKNISSSHIDNPLTRVKINQPYYFKVLKLDKERFSLFLSCKSTDLKDDDPGQRDDFWDQQTYEDDLTDMKNETKKKESNTRVKRVIAHPNFHNVSYESATKMLDGMDWTDCIIRPSANKDSGLSVTWKICDRVYHNFFVKESAKDQVFSIGRQLSVGGEDFEDLDELIARFVQPLIQVSHDITTHKYFFTRGTCEDSEAVEAFVHEKKRELGRSPYVFSASYRQPCQFCISYMFDNTNRIRHEYFKIVPGGVRFRHQNFDSLERMLVWFKRHFHEPPAELRRTLPQQPQYRVAPPQSAPYYPSHQFVPYH
ncbi:CRE-EMB-5 protein [Caenorhabditis remanei]|uniref:Suppressor of Ty 6 homolog n=1 Tax=Caenorhabditis remanei TaxID=31234 RepID=E3MCT7_CAERE|nr:CRE-EMB-5 protein [Caenorhabditis remanei]